MQDIYSEKDPLIGKIIGGKFEITKRIGSGGMATVYKAIQINLGREIALKIIQSNLVNDNESISRFYREAKDLAALSHPNIVTVFDFGMEDGFHYISMEYLQGKNLSEIIHMEGRLDENKIVKYIAPIADAINHLHEKGLIHRDIKSSNIFICSNDRPVLMDFGIAYHQDKTISIGGAILGTAEFMSPEQVRGNVLDGRSDIYSLGVVMYESITGRVPFYSESPSSTLYKVVNEIPPPFPEGIKVSDSLKELVLKTLEKEISKRPPFGSIVYEVLNSIISPSEINRRKTIIEDQKVQDSDASTEIKDDPNKFDEISSKHTKVTGIFLTTPVTTRRNPILFLILGIFLLLLTAFGLYYYNRPQKTDINQLILQANRAFNDNDFSLAHRFAYQVITIDPGNLESRQMITECIHRLFSSYIEPNLIIVHAGTFLMGNNEGGEDEKPQHSVSLSAFLISKTEITNKQFVVFLNALNCSGDGTINQIKVINLSKNRNIISNNGVFKSLINSENLPVIGVTWNGANLFCKTFFGSLPTEAEWEYSASGGENFIYSGSNELNDIAWYESNSTGIINIVGTKKPNAFGLYDLTGNAWEWCNDFYDRTYYKRSVSLNPKGPETGRTKVIKGGDYSSSKEVLRRTFRSDANFSGSSSDAIGFRICIPVK